MFSKNNCKSLFQERRIAALEQKLTMEEEMKRAQEELTARREEYERSLTISSRRLT